MQPKHVITIFAVGIVALLMFVGAQLSGPSADATATPSAAPASTAPAVESPPDLELGEWEIKYDEYGNRSIVGTVTNNTANTYSYAEVNFRVFDDDGAQLGTAMDNISDLAPGVWRFEANVLDGESTSVKFDSIKYVE